MNEFEKPHVKAMAMHLSPRCNARSKRTGKPCQAPAVRSKARCRIHGGLSPGRTPTTGLNTAQMMADKNEVKSLLSVSNELLDLIRET
jgi:glucans biosynthesis protein